MIVEKSLSAQVYNRARAAIPATPMKPAAATEVAALPLVEEGPAPPAVVEGPPDSLREELLLVLAVSEPED